MKDIKGRKIWIIGASSGIGEALAHELSTRGATLALSARTESKLKQLNSTMNGEHLVHAFDVGNIDDFRAAADDVKDKLGQIDSIIVLAAVYAPGMLEAMDIKAAHNIVHINLGGALNAIDAALPVLTDQGTGQFVLCGSVAGYRGLPNAQPYSATKAAIINLAESLHAEMGPKNIDVKLICPGFVKTPMTDKNDFEMPMIITPEKAAKSIAKGLTSRAFEIHFPKKLTLLMKLLRILPNGLFFAITKKMMK